MTSLAAGLAACTAQTAQHGQIFTDAEVQQIQEGMTQDQVMLTLGSPTTRSTVGDGAFYYISTKTKTPVGFMKPQVVDRRVLAVYFDDANQVQRVANYGLEDGRVIDFVSRETPSHSGEDGLLKQLFRNIGQGRPGTGASDNVWSPGSD